MKGPKGNFSAKPMSSAEKKQNQKEFIKTVKPFYKSIIAASLAIAVSTVLSIFAPQWLSKLTDEITSGAALKNINLQKIAELAFILIGCGFVRHGGRNAKIRVRHEKKRFA